MVLHRPVELAPFLGTFDRDSSTALVVGHLKRLSGYLKFVFVAGSYDVVQKRLLEFIRELRNQRPILRLPKRRVRHCD